ncbi:Uncharacterised protein [Legionella beliardensis]|nr:hypothetical protein [Legionella beliardensis]STX55524.1 Uncharacterised protein [Legionella beliardensis]
MTTSVQAADWFPTALVGKNTTNKEAMLVFSDLLVKGFKILLFVVCIVSFYQFVMTVSHGIEAAKKSEGGLMAVFSSYAVMSFIYLSISIVCAYFGFTAVTNFSL